MTENKVAIDERCCIKVNLIGEGAVLSTQLEEINQPTVHRKLVGLTHDTGDVRLQNMVTGFQWKTRRLLGNDLANDFTINQHVKTPQRPRLTVAG